VPLDPREPLTGAVVAYRAEAELAPDVPAHVRLFGSVKKRSSRWLNSHTALPIG